MKKLDKYTKAYYCKHFEVEKSCCNKIKHIISNGYAIKYHCSNCKYFKEK